MRPATVAIPAYGDAAPLVALLQALKEQAGNEETLPVIVVDDCSPQPLAPSLEQAEFAGLDLELVRSEQNRGPGAARNLALARVRTEWVAFLDADMLPGRGWLDRLEATARRPDAPDGIAGAVRDEGDGATPFTHVTDVPELATHHGAGNVAFRTAVLREVGGFDERFYEPARKLHFREDTELRFRLEAAARRIVEDPRWVALHPAHPPSFWTPVLLARRYYFDPLLAREHPEDFRAFVRRRRLGPLSLRQARHYAAVCFAVGVIVAAVGLGLRNLLTLAAGALLLGVGWLATAGSIAWRRTVKWQDVFFVGVAAAIVPFVYLWNYARGLVRFRHLPRL